MSNNLVVFLDFDDVICFNAPYGGYDAKLELFNEEKAHPLNRKLWELLFNTEAKNHLRQLHDTWMANYVISSSWWFLFDKSEITSILERCGLGYVAANLHKDWATPKGQAQGPRSSEINSWIREHPESSKNWVILDDMHSGKDLLRSPLDLNFIVLCQVGVGIQTAEAEKMHQALNKRSEQNSI